MITTKTIDETTAEIYFDGVAVGLIQVERDELISQHAASDYRRIELRTQAYSICREDPERGLDPHVVDASIGASGNRHRTITDRPERETDLPDGEFISEKVAAEKGWFVG